MLHPLPLPLSSCLGCIPPLIGLPSLRFYAVGSSLFLLSVCFVYVLYFIATMSFAGYFLPVLFCMLSMLISDSRFDLVWFRLSCDHGWIRSGSVNVRKQQQKTTTTIAQGESKSRAPTFVHSAMVRHERAGSALLHDIERIFIQEQACRPPSA